MFERLKDIASKREVLYQLVRQQLILKYRRTILGYFWSLLNPLLNMSVTALVFSSLFKLDLKTYVVYLIAGMIPWIFFNAAIVQSSASLIANEGLIKKVYLPKSLFPLSINFSALIDSMLSFIALFAIMSLISPNASWALIFIPIAYILLFTFSLGIALTLSVLTVYLRDLQYLISVLMQALFFLTPIMYKPESITGHAAMIIAMNPLTPFIQLFRIPIVDHVLPDLNVIFTCILLSGLSLLFGVLFFFRQENKIIYRL